jgi:hypothetical protein
MYDPASGTWSATAGMLAKGGHTATPLPDGKVLVEVGTDGSAELYDPGSGIEITRPICGTISGSQGRFGRERPVASILDGHGPAMNS